MYHNPQPFRKKEINLPTSTFFNLPAPKREKLLRAAVAEFARKPFADASINRIIQDAEIPRGSFYQYFTDKSDLFRFILTYFSQQMGFFIMDNLDACGGDLLAVPLKLYDRVLACVQENHEDFQVLVHIVKQNVGMDAGQMWNFAGIIQAALDHADFSRLNAAGDDEKTALLDLLLSSTAQALMSASCGKLSVEDSRKRLAYKVAMIRRGVDKEVSSC